MLIFYWISAKVVLFPSQYVKLLLILVCKTVEWLYQTKMLWCKVPILDVYQLVYSNPEGTLDGAHYKSAVFKTAKVALLVYFLNNIPVNKRSWFLIQLL